MTRQQAQQRNLDIYRIRGSFHLYTHIPKDLAFSSIEREQLTILVNKLMMSINLAKKQAKYIYYCPHHAPTTLNTDTLRFTKSKTATCYSCGSHVYNHNPLIYSKG